MDSVKSEITMNEFSNELICFIFSYIDLIDLTDNCRLVSKRWLALVDSIKFKELVITDLNQCHKSNLYYYTSNRVNPNNLMCLDWLNYWDTNYLTIKFSNFSNLKRLKLDIKPTFLDAEQLNRFIQLEHLEIRSFKSKEQKSTLRLPNLQVLVLHGFNSTELVIEAAKLKVLNCNHLSSIELVYPESIEILDSDNLTNVKSLSNLEVLRLLKTERRDHADRVEEDASLLSKLPENLKEFRFQINFFYGQLINYLRLILQLIDSRKLELEYMGKTVLKIYINEIQLTNGLLDSTDFGLKLLTSNDSCQNKFQMYNRYYEQLSTLPKIKHISYHHLIEHFNHVIPNDFTTKFNNIQHVRIYGTVDQTELIDFLKNCIKLNQLVIYNSNLDQQFYNQLPEITSSLFELSFNDFESDEIDFKFISKFRMLVHLDTNQNIAAQTAKNLIKVIKFLKSFKFMNNGQEISVKKNPRTNESCIEINSKYSDNYLKFEMNDKQEFDKFFDDQKYLI